MAIGTAFNNIVKFLGGGEATEEEKAKLFKEVALITLARATASDGIVPRWRCRPQCFQYSRSSSILPSGQLAAYSE